MKRIAIYGTLRQGDYNYARKLSGYKPLGIDILKGWDMYVLCESYPGVAKGKGYIITEIYEVEEPIAESIESMERGAGYEKETVDTKYGKAEIFYIPTVSENQQHIESGDWFEYLQRVDKGRYQIIQAAKQIA